MLSVTEGIEDMMVFWFVMRGMMVFWLVIGLVSMMYLTVHPYFSIEHYTS